MLWNCCSSLAPISFLPFPFPFPISSLPSPQPHPAQHAPPSSTFPQGRLSSRLFPPLLFRSAGFFFSGFPARGLFVNHQRPTHSVRRPSVNPSSFPCCRVAEALHEKKSSPACCLLCPSHSSPFSLIRRRSSPVVCRDRRASSVSPRQSRTGAQAPTPCQPASRSTPRLPLLKNIVDLSRYHCCYP